MTIELTLLERLPDGKLSGRKLNKVCESGAEAYTFWFENQASKIRKPKKVKRTNEAVPTGEEAEKILNSVNEEQEEVRKKIDGE